MYNLKECITMEQKTYVSIQPKYGLSIAEAAEYFGICDKRLRKLIPTLMDAGCVMQNGNRYLLKRVKCEQFFDRRSAV